VSDLDSQIDQALQKIASAPALDALDALRVSLLGKSGLVTEQLKALGKLAPRRSARVATCSSRRRSISD
jgi:phenylalanyl-tRNA synthetase alpha chain